MRCFGREARQRLISRPGMGRASTGALLIAGWIAVAFTSVQTSSSQTQPGPPAPVSESVPRAVLDKYCISCHNEKLHTAGLALDTVDVTKPGAKADVWERVIRKLQARSMPPAGRPRPDEASYQAVASWLETEIDRVATASPNPGRNNAIHRLNRTEYHNAVRDLFGLDIDVTSLLPGDDTSDSGFDNNADVLSMSTSQLERYLSAARKVTRLATGLPPAAPVIETFEVPELLAQDDRHSEELPLGSRGGTAIRYYFPVDGEYLIKVRLRRTYQDYIMGMGTPQQLDVRIDGALLKRFTVGGESKSRPGAASFSSTEFGDPEYEEYVRKGDEGLQLRVPVKAGPRVIAVSFVRTTWEPEGVQQPLQVGRARISDEVYKDGNAGVGSVEIGGPYGIAGSGETPSRRAIFVCQPRRVEEEGACATEILSRLARRAYRRPVTAKEVQALLGFYKQGRNDGGTFDAGIQFALERVLVDPDFLLRVQRDPPKVEAGCAYHLSDLEVASRLSFFLWSSIPDESLLDLAARGVLTKEPILEQQVRRMLADPRAKSLVDNFASQWLHLRSLADVVADTEVFPEFDDNLLEAFQQETELFIASTLREDRSVLDLLSANYTFVNERLARHYGIPGIYGNRFRRVTLPDPEQRGGLLAHGGLLAATSYPNRTSPVLRGKWLLDTILGAPPPAPPPNVPVLPERGEGGKALSVRARLEQHRKNPVCASCHATIDPLGFALDSFDGLGAWRTVDEAGNPIDASGTMPSGLKVQGLSGLRAMLLDRREQFVGTVTRKLLAFAIGRGLEYYDQPTVRKIVRDAQASEYRWSSLILGIVESPAFLMRNAHTAN
jgi:mono/diheme cytochrome c family protein